MKTILILFIFTTLLTFSEELHLFSPYELREVYLEKALEHDIIEKELIGQELFNSFKKTEDNIKESLNALLIPESMRSYANVTIRLRKEVKLIYKIEFDGLDFGKYNDQLFGVLKKGYQRFVYDNYSLIKSQVLSAIK